jgi:hypothetical protein
MLVKEFYRINTSTSTAALIDGIVHCALCVLHIVACYRRKGPSNAGRSLEAKIFGNQASRWHGWSI